MTDDQQSQTGNERTVVTTPAEREIVTERIFEAPRDRVFAAYTDPELIPKWWGPAGHDRRSSTRWTSAPGGDLALRHVAARTASETGLPRHLPRGHAAGADRADVRVGGHARPRDRRDGRRSRNSATTARR